MQFADGSLYPKHMVNHSAKSLFTRNIKSAQQCLDLYDGVEKLKTSLEIDWLLRAAIVFIRIVKGGIYEYES